MLDNTEVSCETEIEMSLDAIPDLGQLLGTNGAQSCFLVIIVGTSYFYSVTNFSFDIWLF